jgi:quercetin dioxygenase-like cupin family protein
MQRWSMADLEARREATGRPYLEYLRQSSMSGGLYVLAAGAFDGQQPHTEDEIYYVVSGTARFTAGGETIDVTAGDILFVPANEPHHFSDITAQLRLVVVFAPPESMPST